MAIRSMRFIWRLSGEQWAPDGDTLSYRGDWTTRAAQSSFGHVYVGERGAYLRFEFEGNRLGLLSNFAMGVDFTVEIDGIEVASLPLERADTGNGLTYLSPELSQGKHTVIVRSNSRANIDSITVYQAPQPQQS